MVVIATCVLAAITRMTSGSVMTSYQRRVWSLPRGFGSINKLQLEYDATAASFDVNDDEVLVKVNAIGLNFADIFTVLGLYSAATEEAAKEEQFVPGLEFAGTVLKVGASATNEYRVGDRVYGFRRFGAFADIVKQRAIYLRPTPQHWTEAQAAAFVVQALTAWYGLVELGNCQPESRVLVHSAAGGVGLAALTICQALGAQTVGVIGSESKRVAIGQKADRVILRKNTPDAQYLSELDASGPFDIVLDSLGADFFSAAFARLKPQGRLIHFGATASYGSARSGLLKWPELIWAYATRPKIDPGLLTSTNRGVLGFNLIWLCNQDLAMNKCLDELLHTLAMHDSSAQDVPSKGLVPAPHVGRTFPFAQLPDALRFLQSGASTGKVVVVIDDHQPTTAPSFS